MAKSKWDSVKDKLGLVEAWCRDGLIEIEIAGKLGISKATMENYKRDHMDFLNALKRGKEIIDYEVEQKLLKRAMGYIYTEKKTTTNPDGSEFITETIKEVVADTTAQIFWLKNRKPKEWRDKRDIEMSGEMKVNDPFKNLTTEELKKLIKS